MNSRFVSHLTDNFHQKNTISFLQGSNFRRHARDICLPNAPGPMQPMIQAMIDAQDMNIKNACTLMVRYTTSQLQSSFQDFFDNQFECSANIGSSLDYLLRIGTQQSSLDDLCTNYQVKSPSLSLPSARAEGIR